MKKIIINLYNNIFVFSTVFFVGVGIIIYILMGKGAVLMLSDQMLNREQVAVKSGAGAIQNFFLLFRNSLSSVGQDSSVSTNDLVKTEKTLRVFVESFKNTSIGGILLTDANGKALLNPNKSGSGPMPSELMNDRGYFVWAKNAKAGEVFVGESVVSRLGSSKGKTIIPVSTPIIREGKFKGVLTSAVVVSDLTRDFLDPLKISEKSEIYLAKNDGEIIYANGLVDPIGKNILAYLKVNKFLGSDYILGKIVNILGSKSEGKIKIAYPSFDSSGTFSEMLVSYSPVDIGNGQLWYLVISIPRNEALTLMAPFYTRQIILTGFIFIAIIIYSVRFSKMVGFKEGHDLYHKEKDLPNK